MEIDSPGSRLLPGVHVIYKSNISLVSFPGFTGVSVAIGLFREIMRERIYVNHNT